jgi:hypothetical protein
MRAQVLNNCQGPHYIQGQPVDKGGKKPAAGPLLILRPGLNLVDAKELAERRKANPSFDRLFKTTIKPTRAEDGDPRKFGKPMLEVLGKELDDGNPLAKLSYEEASGVVALTENTDLLKEWLKTAKPTDAIVKVINARLKEIASGILA